MAAVSDHLFHIRQLCLTSLERAEGALFIGNIQPVYRALACPAPVLEELDIALHIDDRSAGDFEIQPDDELERMLMVLNFDRRIPTDLFSGHAPCLRKAAFLAMQLHPDGIPALAGLTRLKLTGFRLTAAQLAAIVSTLPKLKALCIEARLGYELPQTPAPAEFRLDELDFQMAQIPRNGSLAPLLRYLKHHHIRDLTTSGFVDPAWLDAFVDPPRTAPRTLHLYGGHRFNCNWHMVYAAGYISSGRSFMASVLFDTLVVRNIFSRIETLVVSVSFLACQWNIPPLEQLTHMSILCPYSKDMSPYAGVRRTSPIPCPALRVLEICGTSPTREKLAVRAGNLERFIGNMFSFSAHRLPRVVLRHVALDVSELLQDQSILGTLAIAEELPAVPTPLDPRARHDRWHLCIDE